MDSPPMTRNIAAPAAIRIQILAFNISPHFIHSKALSIFPAQGQNVIPVFVFRDKALHGITCIQLLPHPAAGLMTSFIVIEAEQNGAELRRLFQHLQYRLNGCAATGYIAVPLPVLRIKGDEGQHIDGCFKHIQTSVCADIMESVLPFL